MMIIIINIKMYTCIIIEIKHRNSTIHARFSEVGPQRTPGGCYQNLH